MTHTNSPFVPNPRTYAHHNPMHHPSSFARSQSHSPFTFNASINTSNRKRNRAQFERNHPHLINDTQTPSKRAKLSNHSLNQSNQENINNNNFSLDDDIKYNIEKNRGFQNHSSKLQSNGIKIRRENILNERRMKRQFVLHQNHQNVLRSKLSEPRFWKFDLSTNYNGSQQNKSQSVDSMDSDEIMTEFNNENNNNLNHRYYQNINSYLNQRHTFIPKTCQSKNTSNSNCNSFNTNKDDIVIINNEEVNDVYDINIDLIEEGIDEKEEIERRRKEEEKERRKREKKKEREELIRKRSEKRIKELKNDKINEKERERRKNELRERIHPQIINRAHPFKHNVIELIKLFYPKTRIGHNAQKKDILRAFKRALAHFHPDRTINKSLREQIEAEEIFKLLSKEKEEFEKKSTSHHQSSSYNAYNKHRKKHGWF